MKTILCLEVSGSGYHYHIREERNPYHVNFFFCRLVMKKCQWIYIVRFLHLGGVIRGNGVFCSVIRKGCFLYDDIFSHKTRIRVSVWNFFFFMVNIFMTKGVWTLVEVHHLAPRCLHPCSWGFGQWCIIFTVTKQLSFSQLNVYVPQFTTCPTLDNVTLNGTA